MLPRIFEFLIINSLYYRVVVIRVPLQGLCYTVRDAVDWLCSPIGVGSLILPIRYCLSTDAKSLCRLFLCDLRIRS